MNLHTHLQARHEALHPTSAPTNAQFHESLQFSDHLALWVVERVATIWCATLFACIGIGSLAGFATGNAILGGICGSFSSYFLQLVLLPLIMIGQNLQGRHGELRAEAEFAIDQHNQEQIDRLEAKLDALLGQVPQ